MRWCFFLLSFLSGTVDVGGDVDGPGALVAAGAGGDNKDIGNSTWARVSKYK